MIVGYHVSFGACGFWLPNDPRGSWSEFVGKWELYLAAGKATRTTEPRSLAHRPHDRDKRLAAKLEEVEPTSSPATSATRARTAATAAPRLPRRILTRPRSRPLSDPLGASERPIRLRAMANTPPAGRPTQ